MKEFYHLLNLDQEGIPYEYFRDFMKDVYNSLFQGDNIFVQPKYYWNTEQDKLWNIYLYFSDPKRRQLIIDLYHKPTEVLKHIGLYHPLWYMSGAPEKRQPIDKFILRNNLDKGYYVCLSELKSFFSKLYHHIMQICQQLSVDDFDETKEFRLVCEYSPKYNIHYWKLDLPVLPQLSYFLIGSRHYSYDFAMVYPRIYYVTEYSMGTYYVLNDMLAYLTNHKICFSFSHLKNSLNVIKEAVEFLNSLDGDATPSLPTILREILYRNKLYVYDNDNKKVYLLHPHARKHCVQRISYKQFTKMIVENTV